MGIFGYPVLKRPLELGAAFQAMSKAEAKLSPKQLATMGEEERRFSPAQLAASGRAMNKFTPDALSDYIGFERHMTRAQSLALAGAEARDFSAAQFGAVGDDLAGLPDAKLRQADKLRLRMTPSQLKELVRTTSRAWEQGKSWAWSAVSWVCSQLLPRATMQKGSFSCCLQRCCWGA